MKPLFGILLALTLVPESMAKQTPTPTPVPSPSPSPTPTPFAGWKKEGSSVPQEFKGWTKEKEVNRSPAFMGWTKPGDGPVDVNQNGGTAFNGWSKDGSGLVARKPCEDDALKEIYAILSNDKNNVFAKMYEITILKMAGKALESGTASLEGFVKKKAQSMETSLKAEFFQNYVESKIVGVYEKYGKKTAVEEIDKAFDVSFEKWKNPCYFGKDTKLANSDVSHLILASTILEPTSNLNETDAAMVWAVNKIAANSKNAEDLSASNRVAKYLGTIQGKSDTKEGLVAKTNQFTKEIRESIQKAYDQVKEKLKVCWAKGNENCPQCQIQAEESFKKQVLDVEAIQKGLLQKVANTENAKLVKQLKGKAGDIRFDFGSTLTKEKLKADPVRSAEFDCEKPKAEEKKSNNSGKKNKGKKNNQKQQSSNQSKQPVYQNPVIPEIKVQPFVQESTAVRNTIVNNINLNPLVLPKSNPAPTFGPINPNFYYKAVQPLPSLPPGYPVFQQKR